MKLASSPQMRAIDAQAIEEYGIPGIVLMENAARSVFEIIAGLEAYKPKEAVVFCGTGNNGGDGFAIARHMANDGANVEIIIAGDRTKIKGDAKTNYDICVMMGIEISEEREDAPRFRPLIIDALLGTGVLGGLRGKVAEAVSAINESRERGAFVVSVDCPTGGDPDNGKVSGDCVKADLCVSLGIMKTGLLLYPLADYAGRIEVGDIGLPLPILKNTDTGFNALCSDDAVAFLPERIPRSHKGTYGKTAILAGGRGMAGAAAYCAKAAYATGCGYVNICTPVEIAPIIQQLAPQAVITPLTEKDGFVCENSAEPAIAKINASKVCLIGPGLGNTPETAAFVRKVIRNAKVPLIIDADALNAIAGNAELLKAASYTPIVTPHPIEMSRLTGLTPDYILDNILETAMEFSKKYDAITVLKDAATVISWSDSDGKGRTFINKSGCSALAKAGSGDVLAGIIAGLSAQGTTSAEAAALGVYIHGEAGSEAAGKHGEYSVSSDNLIESIGSVLRRLSQT